MATKKAAAKPAGDVPEDTYIFCPLCEERMSVSVYAEHESEH